MTAPSLTPARAASIAQFRALLGSAGVLTEAQDVEPYVVDWRKRTRGIALAVLKPSTTQDVAAIVKICGEAGIAIVPQGGNTGQCAGAVPCASGDQVVVSLSRLNRIRALDAQNNTLTAEAGCILATIQEAAAGADRLFPLSLGAQGSCQIGGNLSTNAGGTGVLRYGNARDMVLGLEVVLADGSIWNGLRSLRKDNTGYDLKQIFLGAEGTLGIITAAVLKLHPRPKSSSTALIAVPQPRAAVQLLNRFREGCGDRLTGFELISRNCFDILFKQIPRFSDPLPARYDWYVLAEMTDTLSSGNLRATMESTLERAVEEVLALDAVVASSQTQSDTLWAMREEIPEANRREAPWVRHDVSVPVSNIPELIERGSAALHERFPRLRIVAFGHIGDGNIHFNASTADPAEAEEFQKQHEEVYSIVHRLVMDLGGSFSAEHGIGLVKVHEMALYKSPVELDLMQRIKAALDPNGLMNPGKVLPGR
ncbi:MAG: FAD-binding oxidoreductase [Betaproteobacteria bacterium]|nr:MAG: FAD-binding oxidoreductase [Betaproteobacteria bacterium]